MHNFLMNSWLQVQNAWRANATAVLIYNDRDTTTLEKMKLSTDNGRKYSQQHSIRNPKFRICSRSNSIFIYSYIIDVA